MIPAKRIGPQLLAKNKRLRVNQPKACSILRLHQENSHDPCRETRQASKVRLEIATQSHLAAMRTELLTEFYDAQEDLGALIRTTKAEELIDVQDVKMPSL